MASGKHQINTTAAKAMMVVGGVGIALIVFGLLGLVVTVALP